MEDLDELIAGCKRGDAKMQKELYDRFSARFYALCCRYAPDDDIAKELLVDGFMTIFSEIGNYRGDGAFEGWMWVIMRRVIIADYRRNRKHREAVPLDAVVGMAAPNKSQDSKMDLRDALRAALQSLNDKERVAFNLVAVDEYTFKEVARILRIPESTVKSRFYMAKEKLKKILIKKLGKDYLRGESFIS